VAARQGSNQQLNVAAQSSFHIINGAKRFTPRHIRNGFSAASIDAGTLAHSQFRMRSGNVVRPGGVTELSVNSRRTATGWIKYAGGVSAKPGAGGEMVPLLYGGV
jgi:hypothetical protein